MGTESLEAIETDKAPAALGAYSQAVRKGTPGGWTVYASGQLGIDPATGKLADGVAAQARQAMENLRAVLEAGGSSLGQIVKATIYLTDIADFEAVNKVYAGYVTEPYPARCAVQVAALPKGGLVEIAAEAYA